MTERAQDVLRLEPHMLPPLRITLQDAIAQVHDALVGLERDGYILQPWLGDEVSVEVTAHYTQQAMDGPASSYGSLLAYRDELTRVHDTLQQMEDDYRRREGDNAALWGRLA